MIAQLRGVFSWWSDEDALVDVAGVGYLVHLTDAARSALQQRKEGEEIALPVALVVREEALELYGFASKEERAMFLLLLSVPGVGPKSARNILAVTDPRALQQAIAEENPKVLTRVSGIGKKMAQKIILELKGRILALPERSTGAEGRRAATHEDVVAALRALGYSAQEAREAVERLGDVPPEADLAHKLRAALRALGQPH